MQKVCFSLLVNLSLSVSIVKTHKIILFCTGRNTLTPDFTSVVGCNQSILTQKLINEFTGIEIRHNFTGNSNATDVKANVILCP